MQIQVNTDRHVAGHEALAQRVCGDVANALDRFAEHITRVEVHLSDENGDRDAGADKRCMMEARFKGRQPIAVTELAASLDQAVSGAADKLARLIETTRGRSGQFERTKI